MSHKNFIAMLTLSAAFLSAPSFAKGMKYAECKKIDQLERSAQCNRLVTELELNARNRKKGAKAPKKAAPVVDTPAPEVKPIQPVSQERIQLPTQVISPRDVNVNVTVINDPKKDAVTSKNSFSVADPENVQLKLPKVLEEKAPEAKVEVAVINVENNDNKITVDKKEVSPEVVAKVQEVQILQPQQASIVANSALKVEDINVEAAPEFKLKKPKLLEDKEEVKDEENQSDGWVSKVTHMPVTEIVGGPKASQDQNCNQDPRVDALTKQIELMVAEQGKILNSMMEVSKMMMGVIAQQYQQPLPIPNRPTYEYVNPNPQMNGGWIYMPQFQSAPSFLSMQPAQVAPVAPQAPVVQQSAVDPQGFNGWSVAPSPAYQFAPHYGQFGQAQGSFNFSA